MIYNFYTYTRAYTRPCHSVQGDRFVEPAGSTEIPSKIDIFFFFFIVIFVAVIPETVVYDIFDISAIADMGKYAERFY